MQHHELHMHELNDGQLNFDDLTMQMDRWDFRCEMSQRLFEKLPADSFIW